MKKADSKLKKKKSLEKKNAKNSNNNSKKRKRSIRKHLYLSFNARFILSFIAFVVAFLTCLYLATNAFQFKHPETILYNDTHGIDYKVYLKPNEFYETDYLGKNMMYVANLIDKISIDFRYQFHIEKPYTMDFDYKIIGNLIIANASTNASYFEKEYTLFESEPLTMKNDTDFTIQKNVKIDYDYYNNLANTFKTNYGVSTESYLKVYLQVRKDGKKYNIDLSNTTNNGVTIPLSESSVQIKFDSSDLNKNNELKIERSWVFQPYIFSFEIISFVLSVYFLVKLMKLMTLMIKPKSSYDKFISDTLKTYDRIIGETKTGIDFEKYHIIEMATFEELLDIRDNLKMPIMYYNIIKHQKCYFYIKNQQDVYLFKLKATDMETQNEKNKKIL